MTRKLTKDNFWDTNLSDIESTFLSEDAKITDYNVYLDSTVPPQGSVLLDNVINIDKSVSNPTFLEKINYYLSSILKTK